MNGISMSNHILYHSSTMDGCIEIKARDKRLQHVNATYRNIVIWLYQLS